MTCLVVAEPCPRGFRRRLGVCVRPDDATLGGDAGALAVGANH